MSIPTSDREVATVKWFNDKKGFGFLVDSEGQDVFVHHRNIEPGTEGYKTLADGERVEFLPVQTDKGCQLRNWLNCRGEINPGSHLHKRGTVRGSKF